MDLSTFWSLVTSLITQWKDLGNDHNNLILKPSPNSELLVNQFNNAIPENINDPEKIEKMHNIETPQNEWSPCFFNKNFNDLQHLLSCTKNILNNHKTSNFIKWFE